jgi:hypothetical protein
LAARGAGGFAWAWHSQKHAYRAGIIALFILVLLMIIPPAEAARVALVIGNNALKTSKLAKAANHADARSRELAKLGFKVVTAKDVGRRAMSRALVELEGKVEAGDTALVYFAASLPPRSTMSRCRLITTSRRRP